MKGLKIVTRQRFIHINQWKHIVIIILFYSIADLLKNVFY